MNPTPRKTALTLLLLAFAATTTFLPAQPADPPPAAQSKPSAETIRLAVENQLLRSDAIEGHGIDVTVDKGIVTLSGRVQNLLARQIAARLAQRVHGVQCRNAHVRLYGIVDTEFEKEHAEWTAGCQNGVVHVSDYLAVRKQWVPKSDPAIQADLKDKLEYGFVDPNNQVTATVDDGVAILNGTVDTWLMWQTAIDMTLEACARRPHNLIEVRAMASRPLRVSTARTTTCRGKHPR